MTSPTSSLIPADWLELVSEASVGLRQAGEAIRLLVDRHGERYLDQQCEAIDLSQRIQKLATIVCLAMFVSRESDATTQTASQCLARALKREVAGQRPSPDDFTDEAALGLRVIEGPWAALAGVPIDRPVHPLFDSAPGDGPLA